MEAELAELQADVRELSAKKRDARARSIIADLDERLDAVAQEIQKVIEHALVNIGADNPKVTRGGGEIIFINIKIILVSISNFIIIIIVIITITMFFLYHYYHYSKVTKRGKEMMSSEAHATVYSIQAEQYYIY